MEASNIDLSGMFTNGNYFNPYYYFYKRFNAIPHRQTYFGINREKLIGKLSKKFDLKKSTIAINKVYSYNDVSSEEYGSSIFDLGNELILCFRGASFENLNDIALLHSPDKAIQEYSEIINAIKKCRFKKPNEKNKINILRKIGNGDYDFFQHKIFQNKVDISSHYNDDLVSINETILKRLSQKNDKGLVILHGKPGTGKTSYIRYLLSKLRKPKLFIPPDLAPQIASPDFISFLKSYENSILIIEDAETILQKREGVGTSAVSNLLNLSDGLLSDCFNIQVICTFNNDISSIDKALLRKGRLIAKYEFKELEISKAQKLSEVLGFASKISYPATLAEIYNQGDADFFRSERKSIGFKTFSLFEEVIQE